MEKKKRFNISKKQLFFTIISIPILFTVIGSFLTVMNQFGSTHTKFLTGTLPDEFPNGYYSGTTKMPVPNWLGKNFYRESRQGINIWEKDEKRVEKYKFHMLQSLGINDHNKHVIRIDYNHEENPFYIKPFMDEIVEVEPGLYLGKAHFRIHPNVGFTIGYFELRSEQ